MPEQGTGAPSRGRWRVLTLIALAATLARAPSAGAREPGDGALSLERALELARASNPRVAFETQRVARARGRLESATTYPFNPELSGSAARREGAGGTSTDFGAELAQEIEVGGQRGLRVAGARADLLATREDARWALQTLRAEVERAYVEASRAHRSLEIGRSGAAIARRLLELTDRRERAGTASRIELNAVRADLGRAIAELALLEAEHEAAREALAELLGWSDGALPPLADDGVAAPVAEPAPVVALVEEALAARADLRALRAREQAAEARLGEAERGWIPNVTLGAFVEREEGTDTIAGGRLSVPLPLWNRATGEAASARAALAQARSTRERAVLGVRREIAGARAELGAALRALAALDASAVAPLEENLELLDRAFAARRVAFADVLLIRRSFVDARRARVEALARAARAEVDLRLATGRMDADPSRSAGAARSEEQEP